VREAEFRRLVRRKLYGLFVLSVLGLRRQRDLAAFMGDDLGEVERDVNGRHQPVALHTVWMLTGCGLRHGFPHELGDEQQGDRRLRFLPGGNTARWCR